MPKTIYIRLILIFAFTLTNCTCFASSDGACFIVPGDSVSSEITDYCLDKNLDELKKPLDYSFSAHKVIVPAVVFAAGVAGTYLLGDFKNLVRDKFAYHNYGRKTKVDEYLQYSTAVGYLGVGFIPGVKSRCAFKERLMAGVTAYAVMAVAVNAMKYSFRHTRPDASTRNSFPSGHSATVFTGAELMRIEYGNYVGIVGYVAAVSVGALRIYNDRHWITDVIGGAAIGVLSARAGYWLLPYERKLFGIDRKKEADSSIALLPMIGETNGVFFSLSF